MQELPDSKVDSKYLRARKRVENIKEFYSHLIAYCLIIPFLAFINYKTFWEYQWFWYPMVGWGIGLGFHAYSVFVNTGILGPKWEERKIQEFMEEEEEKMRWG